MYARLLQATTSDCADIMKFSQALGVVVLATITPMSNGEPIYKNPNATIDDRVSDLLKHMSIEEKTSQLIQGDMTNYLNLTDGTFNKSGLEWSMTSRGHAVWTGLYTTPEIVNKAARLAQDYQMNQTELGKHQDGKVRVCALAD